MPSPHLKLIQNAVLKAGRYLARDYGEIENLQVSRKGAGNFVTSADLKAEKILIEELQRDFEGCSILSEEAGEILGSKKDFKFIIDPIDGTTNFMHGSPFFCVSVALMEKSTSGKNEITKGVIYSPITDDLFIAEKGEGAFLNDRRMQTSGRREFEQALFTAYLNKSDILVQQQDMKAISAVPSHVRIMGSAALELAYVAAGKLDGMWHRNLRIWDIAAGILMVQEARGIVSEINGRDGYLESGNIIASNPAIYDNLRSKILPCYK